MDLLELHEKVEHARNRFAPNYRALIWRGHASRDGGQYQLDQLVVVYKKNGRFRLEYGREPAMLRAGAVRLLCPVLFERVAGHRSAAPTHSASPILPSALPPRAAGSVPSCLSWRWADAPQHRHA